MRGSSAGTSAMSCGRDDHVLEPPQRAVLGQRLLGEDVERGALERAVLQPLGERLLVDHRAAADVDEHGAGLDRGQRLGVEQPAGGVGAGERDDDRVGAPDERPQLAHRVQLVDVRHGALEACA